MKRLVCRQTFRRHYISVLTKHEIVYYWSKPSLLGFCLVSGWGQIVTRSCVEYWQFAAEFEPWKENDINKSKLEESLQQTLLFEPLSRFLHVCLHTFFWERKQFGNISPNTRSQTFPTIFYCEIEPIFSWNFLPKIDKGIQNVKCKNIWCNKP